MGGVLIKNMTFPDTGINYTSLAVGSVPEPATMLLLGAGLTGVALLRRRRRA